MAFVRKSDRSRRSLYCACMNGTRVRHDTNSAATL